jgi:methionyl-tRNA formyltransferase
MLRIAFAGTPAFAVPALDALAGSGHTVVGVLTKPDRPAGRGRTESASAVKLRALQLGLPLAQPARLSTPEERSGLQAWAPELLVVVAYGLILPQAVLDIPRLGCLNIHASLLPRWRGAAPIQRAILAGDHETGVCVMQLEAGLDTGPVLGERRVPIGERTTAAELHDQLALLGAEKLLQVIEGLVQGKAQPRPQPATGISYATKIDKREALIDWTQSAVQLGRQVRAFNPWPVAETRCQGTQLRIWMAHAVEASTAGALPGAVLGLRAGTLHVACGEGVLAIESLQQSGRRVISAADFAHAMPLAGLSFG